MNKYYCLFVISIITSHLLFAQGKGEFKDGYLLKNNSDTIKCKILYDFEHPHTSNSVTVQIEGDQITFQAGSFITGFGVYGDTILHEYRNVSTNNIAGKTNVTRDLFLRKIVAGTINLYRNNFRVMTTKRGAFDTPIDPKTTTIENFITYYISKNDPSKPVLNKAVAISIYKKKDFEKYIGDNKELFENAGKDLTVNEVINLLNQYNSWAQTKK